MLHRILLSVDSFFGVVYERLFSLKPLHLSAVVGRCIINGTDAVGRSRSFDTANGTRCTGKQVIVMRLSIFAISTHRRRRLQAVQLL